MVKILTNFKINKPVMCAIQADIRFTKNSRIYFNVMHTIAMAFRQDIARITHRITLKIWYEIKSHTLASWHTLFLTVYLQAQSSIAAYHFD